MRDAMEGRLWVAHHERLSEDLSRVVDKARAHFSGSGDPLPIVARAMALVLAVSLTSLSFSATMM